MICSRLLPAILLTVGIVCCGKAALSAERYGGVEVGAKGVKSAAVEIDTSGPTTVVKELKLDKKTIDLTISRLKDQKFEKALIGDVADVVKDFIRVLHEELKIPEKNIQVVASSGVPFTDNFADLTKAIFDKTGKTVGKLDATEEALLTTVALVPKSQWQSTIVMDVGSGNTKGGEFRNDSGKPDSFIAYNVPFGTVTLGKEIEKRAAEAGTTRSQTGPDVSRQLVGNPLRQAFTAKTVRTGQPKTVLFAGGSVWAMVTILKPETALQPFPQITAGDVRSYLALITEAAGNYPEIDFARVADPKAREAAQADYDKIRGAGGATPIFTTDDLLAGALLLNQVSDALDFSSRQVLFDRKAVTAWITARITPQEYWHLLPQALGREVPQAKATAASGSAGASSASLDPPASSPSPSQPNRGFPATGATPGRRVLSPTGPTVVGSSGCCGGVVMNDPCGAAWDFDGRPWSTGCGCSSFSSGNGIPRSVAKVTHAGPMSSPQLGEGPAPRTRPASLLTAAGIASQAAERLERKSSEPTPPLMQTGHAERAGESMPDPFMAEYHFGQGTHLFWHGDYAAALTQFQSAVTADARDARFWYFKGLSESRLGDNDQALNSLAAGVALEAKGQGDAESLYRSLVRLQGSERLMLREAVFKVRRANLQRQQEPAREQIAQSVP